MTPPSGAAVLVVDDNPEFIDVVATILGRDGLGFEVHGVESGSDALAFLERRGRFAAAPRPAFVVLDFRLPDLNAPEVLRRIAGSETLRTIPVLVVSQANWDVDESATLAAGAKAFRVKPSRVRALREILVEFWDVHASPAVRTPRTD